MSALRAMRARGLAAPVAALLGLPSLGGSAWAEPAGTPPASGGEGLAVPSTVVSAEVAEGRLVVSLTLVNASDRPVLIAPAAGRGALLSFGGRAAAVWLEPVARAGAAAMAAIPPGGFQVQRYETALPSGIEPGATVTVDVDGPALNLAAVRLPDGVGAGPAGQSPPSGEPAPMAGAAVPTAVPTARPAPGRGAARLAVEPLDRERSLAGKISVHEPSYALYATSPGEGKLQLSLKYQPFGRDQLQRGPLDGLYLAYTQTMFAELARNSSPVSTIYQPEIFYRYALDPLFGGSATLLQLGARHESNGRSGRLSRNTNFLYLQASQSWAPGGGWTLTVRPRAWVYIFSDAENPDIERYRGWTSLDLDLGQTGGETGGLYLRTSLRGNPDSGRGAFRADLSYPLRALLDLGLDLYLHAQLFTGYGEDLLRYDEADTRLRFGISIAR